MNETISFKHLISKQYILEWNIFFENVHFTKVSSISTGPKMKSDIRWMNGRRWKRKSIVQDFFPSTVDRVPFHLLRKRMLAFSRIDYNKTCTQPNENVENSKFTQLLSLQRCNSINGAAHGFLPVSLLLKKIKTKNPWFSPQISK